MTLEVLVFGVRPVHSGHNTVQSVGRASPRGRCLNSGSSVPNSRVYFHYPSGGGGGDGERNGRRFNERLIV